MPIVPVNGEEIYYQHHKGVAERAPLVLVHGAGGSFMHWPRELRRLPGQDVYALDLPGHGKSGGQGRSSVPEYAAVVRDFADALGLPPFVLAGHSMGGAITQEFALTWPNRLAGMVLVGSGAKLRVAPQILEGITADFEGTTAMVTQWAHGESTPADMLQEYTRRLREVPAHVTRGDYAACDVFDRRADVARITLPVLLICGTADRMTPAKFSQWLNEQLPDSELVLVPDAGHMVMLERPELTAEAVARFMDGLGERPAANPGPDEH